MILSSFIQEVVKTELSRLKKEYRPTVFSLEELKACENTEEAQLYLVRTLGDYIGRGAYRTTYAIDEERIIKIARSDLTQNQQEVKNSQCLPSKYVVRVLDYHPDFWWIIEERLNKIGSNDFISEFQKKLKMNFSDLQEGDIQEIIACGASENPYDYYHYYQEMNSKFLQSKWYRKLIDGLKKCHVSSEDFHNENWGVRPSTGDLVILDLGF